MSDRERLIERLQRIVVGMANDEEDAVLEAIAMLAAAPQAQREPVAARDSFEAWWKAGKATGVSHDAAWLLTLT